MFEVFSFSFNAVAPILLLAVAGYIIKLSGLFDDGFFKKCRNGMSLWGSVSRIRPIPHLATRARIAPTGLRVDANERGRFFGCRLRKRRAQGVVFRYFPRFVEIEC